MQKLLIIGATSAIAKATARRFASQGAHIYLLARDAARLADLAADLTVRGAASAHVATLDANAIAEYPSVLNTAIQTLGGIDIVLIAHGTLSNQNACEQDINLTLQEFTTNALSVIALLTHLANYCEQQQHGTLAVISSVAGDRGRQSNYIYGTAKGAVSIFLQGLRNRLHKHGVHVLTIKPGFVNTPMTAAFKKGILWAEPDTIAAGIVMAIEKQRDVVYLPFWWRYILLIIRVIPERLFKRLSL